MTSQSRWQQFPIACVWGKSWQYRYQKFIQQDHWNCEINMYHPVFLAYINIKICSISSFNICIIFNTVYSTLKNNIKQNPKLLECFQWFYCNFLPGIPYSIIALKRSLWPTAQNCKTWKYINWIYAVNISNGSLLWLWNYDIPIFLL